MNIYLTPFLLTLCVILLVLGALDIINLVTKLILKILNTIITQRKTNEFKRVEKDCISKMKCNNQTFENSNEFFDALSKDINEVYNTKGKKM